MGDLYVDFTDRVVRIAGNKVELSSIEFQLLRALVRARGAIATHRQLLAEIWGPNAVDRVHYLRIYMKRLRFKIEPSPAQPRYLLTEPGVGYRLSLEPE